MRERQYDDEDARLEVAAAAMENYNTQTNKATTNLQYELFVKHWQFSLTDYFTGKEDYC